MALGTLIPDAFFVEAAPGPSRGAVAMPDKATCRQTTLDGPQRRRRFYLAVLIGRLGVLPIVSGVLGLLDRVKRIWLPLICLATAGSVAAP